ncbi:MAG TPA: MFS transporter, partial [Trueperaceae bacterium]|nr:MFS transporter [Trueperaceae bacterium]
MFYSNNNRDFVKYWLAQNISALGDAIRRISLTLWVFDISSGSGLAIALLAMVEITPQLVLAPFTGVLIDRWDRKTILIITNICRALLSLLLIIATVNENLVLAYFFISISSIFAAFSSLTQDAIVPTLVEDKDLQAANSAIQIGRQLAFVLGPLTGAYFYTSYGFESSFLFDAATFLLAAILFYFLPIVSSISLRKSQKLNFVSFLDDFVAGLKYLQSSAIIRASMIITVLFSIASGINSTTMIFFVANNLGRQAADIAYLSVANGITQILIGGYILIYARKMPLNKLLLFSLFIMSIGAIVIASS